MITNYAGLLGTVTSAQAYGAIADWIVLQASAFSWGSQKRVCILALCSTCLGEHTRSLTLANKLELIAMYSWYKRNELGTRVGVFFSSATIAGAFSAYPGLHPCSECAETNALRRIARRCHTQHGRCRRKAWLGMDLHLRRTSHRRLRGSFVLHPLGLPRHREVPKRNRTYVLSRHVSEAMLNDVILCALGVWVVRELQADMKYSAGGETFKMKYVWQCLTDRQTWLASESLPLP